MAIGPGTRIGQYEIVAALGEGGMGQVWRARDLRLPREVAIKVLHESIAADADRLARFTRESEILATLNHPHIATIHGVEDSPFGRAIVMELVPGDSLDARLAVGRLSLAEALALARDVADALESAHEHGIVHRDMKPGNLKLADGRVKVLDFGLAKTGAGSLAAGLSQSPTVLGSTQAGTLLGTAAYMSPEQARGEAVDRRADVWAFGCVLYEMLAGRRAFDGSTLADVLGAIVKSEPDLAALPAETPPSVRRLVDRCLRKDLRSRLRDIGDARLVLEDAIAGRDVAVPRPAVSAGRTRRLHASWAAAAVGLAAIAGLAGYRVAGGRGEAPLRKLEIMVTDPIVNTSTRPQLSPDGESIVYAAADRLWIRRLDQTEPREVPGSLLAERPFWSPDGRELAFGARARLWKVAVDGGAAVPLCDLPGTGRIIAGVWRPDGSIVFSSWFGSLYSVPARGGDPVVFHADASVTDFHEITLLPDGRTLLVVPHRAVGNLTEIAAVRDGQRRTVMLAQPRSQLDMPRYSSTGHLVFVRHEVGEGIWAVRFDPDTLQMVGEPFRVVAGSWGADVSAGGTLIYSGHGVPHELAWRDRSGARIGAVGPPQWLYAMPALSVDGRQVAVAGSDIAFTASNRRQLWTIDTATGRDEHLPVSPDLTNEEGPEWSPDGTRIVSVDVRRHPPMLVWRTVGDGSLPRALTPGSGRPSYSPDGRTIAFAVPREGKGTDIWTIDLSPAGRAGTPAELIAGDGNQRAPRFSPDGRYIAYESDESGRLEIYVRRVPPTGERWMVSRGGGSSPRWSRKGELFYRSRDGSIMAVAVTLGPAFRADEPRALFVEASVPGSMSREFDVTPDGQRFLVVGRAPGTTARIIVVQNWLREFGQ